jgi:hypothetical protein
VASWLARPTAATKPIGGCGTGRSTAPGADRPLRRRGRRHRCRPLRSPGWAARGGPRWRPQFSRLVGVRRRAGDRPLPDEGGAGRPGQPDSASSGGVRLGELDRETQAFGLAVPGVRAGVYVERISPTPLLMVVAAGDHLTRPTSLSRPTSGPASPSGWCCCPAAISRPTPGTSTGPAARPATGSSSTWAHGNSGSWRPLVTFHIAHAMALAHRGSVAPLRPAPLTTGLPDGLPP